MTQTRHFDQLNLNDAADGFDLKDQQIDSEEANYDANSRKPPVNDFDYGILPELALLSEQESSSSSVENSYWDIPMNTNHLRPEGDSFDTDDVAETGLHNDDFTVVDGRFPPNALNFYRVNEWSPVVPERTYCIRNETRPGRSRDVNECATSIEDLFDHPMFECRKNGEQCFFHATSWRSGESLSTTCPKPGRGPQDLAPHGAFYLNPDYPDAYQWLYSKTGSFEGEHAMLIYKFKPEDLSSNGKKLDEREWRDLIYQSNTAANNYDWVEGPMNTNPLGTNEPGQKIRPCRRSDGEIAMQFVIRSPRMCRQIHKHLVGIIFYEKINPPGTVSDRERCDHQDHSSRSHKRRRSSTHSKTRGAKQSSRRR